MMQVFLCLSSIDHFLCKGDFSKILHMFIIRFSMFVQDKTFLRISSYRRRPGRTTLLNCQKANHHIFYWGHFWPSMGRNPNQMSTCPGIPTVLNYSRGCQSFLLLKTNLVGLDPDTIVFPKVFFIFRYVVHIFPCGVSYMPYGKKFPVGSDVQRFNISRFPLFGTVVET